MVTRLFVRPSPGTSPRRLYYSRFLTEFAAKRSAPAPRGPGLLPFSRPLPAPLPAHTRGQGVAPPAMAMTGSAPSSCDTFDLLLLVFSLNASNSWLSSVPTGPMLSQPICPHPHKGIKTAHSRCSLTVWPREEASWKWSHSALGMAPLPRQNLLPERVHTGRGLARTDGSEDGHSGVQSPLRDNEPRRITRFGGFDRVVNLPDNDARRGVFIGRKGPGGSNLRAVRLRPQDSNRTRQTVMRNSPPIRTAATA